MLSEGCSAAVNGIEAYPIEVEVNAGRGETIIVMVGLPGVKWLLPTEEMNTCCLSRMQFNGRQLAQC